MVDGEEVIIQGKPILLAVWPVRRKDWVAPFRELTHHFHIIFLAGVAQNDQAPNEVTDFAETRYWSEFADVNELLRQLQPQAIVFMSVDSGLSTTLNYLARRQGIRTFLLQHGVYTTYRDYRLREKRWKKADHAGKLDQQKAAAGFSTVRFIKASLTPMQNWLIAYLALYQFAVRKKGPYWASKWCFLPVKRPDTYLCFSRWNSTIHRQTDRVGEDRIRYIGSPELAGYLEAIPEDQKIQERFYLHLDQALAENSLGEEIRTKEDMKAFYLRLNAWCKARQAKLYIKLHPESYPSTWLPKDENILYLRHTSDLNRYIQSALGCFGFYSTMVIPAIYWKPTVLFKVTESALQLRLKGMQAVGLLPFDATDWNMGNEPTQESKTKLFREFIGSGRPYEQLIEAVHESI